MTKNIADRNVVMDVRKEINKIQEDTDAGDDTARERLQDLKANLEEVEAAAAKSSSEQSLATEELKLLQLQRINIVEGKPVDEDRGDADLQADKGFPFFPFRAIY